MTTAQKAEDLAQSLRYKSDPVSRDAALMLGEYASLLDAALPDKVQRNADWHEKVFNGNNEDDIAASAHRDRATLLNVVMVLTAELSDLLDKHNKAVSELVMKWNVATGERDAARTEIDMLRSDLATAQTSLEATNAKWTSETECANAEQAASYISVLEVQADRLAEGLRLIMKRNANDADDDAATEWIINNLDGNGSW